MGDEIEVTQAMVDAGVKALWASGIVDGQGAEDYPVVAGIFRAMYRASQLQQEGPERPEQPT